MVDPSGGAQAELAMPLTRVVRKGYAPASGSRPDALSIESLLPSAGRCWAATGRRPREGVEDASRLKIGVADPKNSF